MILSSLTPRIELFLFICYTILCCCKCRLKQSASKNTCNLSNELLIEIRSYQNTVNKIVEQIVFGKYKGETYKSLSEMTDTFGPRLLGSKVLENAIDFVLNEMKTAKLDNIGTENVKVPHWIRGHESAWLLFPRKVKLPIFGLGTSVGTPQGGIIGDVIVVESFDELQKIPDNQVKGKIVVFAPKWQRYEKNAEYREYGASEAAKKGAIASLIRSTTQFSIGSLHTGFNEYKKGVEKIPSAAITVEDAKMLLRMYRRDKKLRIHIKMIDMNLSDSISRNAIGELTGRVFKNKSVVVLSGHLDSWDVGVGAMDDGGGAFISWKALQYLKDMGLRPKRTLRAILWTGEEFGMIGAQAYQKVHERNEKDEFNFFMESDMGTFEPLGLDFSGNKDAECIFKEILSLMKPLNATNFATPIEAGPDIELWVKRGFPGASLLNRNNRYFWFHHSTGDSMLVEDPNNLDKCTALFAATAYVIADLSIDFPRNVIKSDIMHRVKKVKVGWNSIRRKYQKFKNALRSG